MLLPATLPPKTFRFCGRGTKEYISSQRNIETVKRCITSGPENKSNFHENEKNGYLSIK